MDYQSKLNAHAYNAIEKQASIPDYRLGIGDAEVLDSQDVLLPDLMIPKPVAENLDELHQATNAELMVKIASNEIEVNDLNANTTALDIGGAVI